MDYISITTAILTLIAGIGVFLVACKMMSMHMESASSRRLKQLFAKTGKNPWLGVGIGALGTAVIQSSGAVTVMIIGFVNVGIMSLAQAATIIYGANIGTTITAQIVALGLFGGKGLSTTVIFSALAGVGTFIELGAKRERWQQAGGVMTGFGLLFVGLHMMSSAMDEFAALDSVKIFLASISNPVLLVLIGTLLTAIIQSSSVLTSISITMVFSGLLSLDQGIYLTMGSNIGSCVVAVMAALGSGTNAKRTALIHLIFNIMGVVIFMILALLLHIFSKGIYNYGYLFERMFPHTPQLQLAMFHTIFNTCTMLIALPLTNRLVKIACRIISEHSSENETSEPHLYYLDESMLRTPAVAVRQLKAEIEHMAAMAMDNFHISIDIVTTLNYKDIEKFRNTEIELNFLNSELTRYIVLISEEHLNNFDNQFISRAIKNLSDLERVGDYAENIVEYADNLRSLGMHFSESAILEIKDMEQLVNKLYKEIMTAYHSMDLNALERANQYEDQVDRLTEQMEANHIRRLVTGTCTPQVGAEYISLAQNVERVADHLINVGKSIRR